MFWAESKMFVYLTYWSFAQSFYPEGRLWRERPNYSPFSPQSLVCSGSREALTDSHCISWALLLSGSIWVWLVGDTCRRTENWMRERERFLSCFLPALMCCVHKSSFYGMALPPAGNTFSLFAPSDLLLVIASHCRQSLGTLTSLLSPLTLPSSL